MIDAFSKEDVLAGAIEQAQMGKCYEFCTAPQFIVGDGVSARLGEVLARRSVKHVFIVADPIVSQLGLMGTALRSLRLHKIPYTIFDDIAGEPNIIMVRDAGEAFKSSGADCVVGFGGGSAIDAAKAVAAREAGHARLEDISSMRGTLLISPLLVAIPTTAGTGSEVTDFTVIIDETGTQKIVASHPCIMPDLALVDPRLTYGVPPLVTAATGMDVLTHAIEAYVSRETCTITQALAHRAILIATQSLPIAAGRGDDAEARYGMAIASCMAGMAFSNAGLGLCHAMAHQIGARFHLAHGAANAVLLPHIMEFNLTVRPTEFAEIAKAMGAQGKGLTVRELAEQSVVLCQKLIADIHLPEVLPAGQAGEAELAQMADRALEDICMGTNPRSASKDDVIRLYRKVLQV